MRLIRKGLRRFGVNPFSVALHRRYIPAKTRCPVGLLPSRPRSRRRSPRGRTGCVFAKRVCHTAGGGDAAGGAPWWLCSLSPPAAASGADSGSISPTQPVHDQPVLRSVLSDTGLLGELGASFALGAVGKRADNFTGTLCCLRLARRFLLRLLVAASPALPRLATNLPLPVFGLLRQFFPLQCRERDAVDVSPAAASGADSQCNGATVSYCVNGGQEVQRRAGKKCGAGDEGIARGLGWPAAV